LIFRVITRTCNTLLTDVAFLPQIDEEIASGHERIEEKLASTLNPELRTYSAHIGAQYSTISMDKMSTRRRKKKGLSSLVRKVCVAVVPWGVRRFLSRVWSYLAGPNVIFSTVK